MCFDVFISLMRFMIIVESKRQIILCAVSVSAV